MRNRIIAALALLPLVGAAPADSGIAAAAVECRADLDEAIDYFAALPITRTNGRELDEGVGRTQDYDPAGVTVLGQRIKGLFVNEQVKDGRHRHVYSAELLGSFEDARAAMLKLHGKRSCDSGTATPGERDCDIQIGVDPATGISRGMIVLEYEGDLVASCFYRRAER